MLETKSFKFVRNPLWPVKAVLEISDQGINNKGKLVKWEDITEFMYSVKLVNGSPSYMYNYRDKAGKKNIISMVVLATGKKSKKQMFEEIYWAMDQGFKEKVVAPRAKEMAEKIGMGESFEVGKCKLSIKGIEIRKGLIKKEPAFIPWEDVVLNPPNQGAYAISSAQNKKTAMYINYETHKEARMLEGIVGVMSGGIK